MKVLIFTHKSDIGGKGHDNAASSPIKTSKIDEILKILLKKNWNKFQNRLNLK